MNIKKTQQFVYFQNKARHYANLRGIKPAVKTHRQNRSLSPIELPHHMPYIKRYELEKQNEGIINRIGDIMAGDKTQIQKQGYTRYNRPFVPKSHYAIQHKKTSSEIDEGNNKLANRVLKMKPSIGTIQNWNQRYSTIQERKKNISRYNEDKLCKGTLNIYTSSKFIPQHYRSFLSNPKYAKGYSIEEESPEEMPLNMKLRVEQLFQLPKLKRLRGSLTRLDESQIDQGI